MNLAPYYVARGITPSQLNAPSRASKSVVLSREDLARRAAVRSFCAAMYFVAKRSREIRRAKLNAQVQK